MLKSRMKGFIFPKVQSVLSNMNTDKIAISKQFPCEKKGFKYFFQLQKQ